jgi:hypothetical protein
MLKKLQQARLSWHVICPSGVVFGLKIVGHGNPYNNLESHCTSRNSLPNIKTENTLLCTQDLITDSKLKPTESSPHYHVPFLSDQFEYNIFVCAQFPQVFSLQFYYIFCTNSHRINAC